MEGWKLVKNSPNYVSECGRFVAVYRNTVKGFGNFWVFKANTPMKDLKLKNALNQGGLPTKSTLAKF